MEIASLLEDLAPEELDPRLELQMIVDPMSQAFSSPSTNNNNLHCIPRGSCVLQPAGN